MSHIKFYLFGKFHFEVDGLIRSLEPRKAEELLVFLLLNRDQAHRRERVADILWGEISSEQSKGYLRKVLWQLQSTLEPVCGKDLLSVDAEWIQFTPHVESWLDIAVFEKAFKQTQGIRSEDIDIYDAQHLEDAVELYQGGLLDGWYQDWCLYEREHFQFLYLAMLDKLMIFCEAHGDYEKGLALGEQILHVDKAHERTHRWLMRLHYLAGDRTTALRQYQKCAAILREELDVEPAETTRQLYEMIRQGNLEELPRSIETRNDEVDKASLKIVMNHLSSFHKELSRMQSKMSKDMQIIQRTLKGQR